MKKRLVATILCIVMAVSLFCVTAFAATNDYGVYASGNAMITGWAVNFRSGPGTEFSSGGYVNTNDKGYIKRIYPNRYIQDWIKLQMTSGDQKDYYGWVHMDYVYIINIYYS